MKYKKFSIGNKSQSGSETNFTWGIKEGLLRKIALEEQIETLQKYTGLSNILIPKNDFLAGFFQFVIPYISHSEEKITETLGVLKVREAVNLLLNTMSMLKDFLFDFSEANKIDLEKFMNHNFHFNVPVEKFAQLTGRSFAGFKLTFKKHLICHPDSGYRTKDC